MRIEENSDIEVIDEVLAVEEDITDPFKAFGGKAFYSAFHQGDHSSLQESPTHGEDQC
jgi:hypothetical protein